MELAFFALITTLAFCTRIYWNTTWAHTTHVEPVQHRGSEEGAQHDLWTSLPWELASVWCWKKCIRTSWSIKVVENSTFSYLLATLFLLSTALWRREKKNCYSFKKKVHNGRNKFSTIWFHGRLKPKFSQFYNTLPLPYCRLFQKNLPVLHTATIIPNTFSCP